MGACQPKNHKFVFNKRSGHDRRFCCAWFTEFPWIEYCFSHQLELTLVAVAKEGGDCTWFFQQLAHLLTALDMSCKKMRMLRIAQAEELIDALDLEEVQTGTGQNQDMGLGRPCDTRWGSLYMLQ